MPNVSSLIQVFYICNYLSSVILMLRSRCLKQLQLRLELTTNCSLKSIHARCPKPLLSYCSNCKQTSAFSSFCICFWISAVDMELQTHFNRAQNYLLSAAFLPFLFSQLPLDTPLQLISFSDLNIAKGNKLILPMLSIRK